MTGNIPFVYVATCGCVFSSAGLRAISVPSSSSSEEEGSGKEPCPQCAKPFSRADDVRTINPGPEELEKMMEKMLAAKASTKSNKKKRKDLASTNGAAEDVAPPSKRTKAAPNSVTLQDVPSPAPSINPMVSSVARKVTEQIAEEEKKRKANMSKAIASLYAPKDGGTKKEKGTFLTMNTFTRVSQ